MPPKSDNPTKNALYIRACRERKEKEKELEEKRANTRERVRKCRANQEAAKATKQSQSNNRHVTFDEGSTTSDQRHTNMIFGKKAPPQKQKSLRENLESMVGSVATAMAEGKPVDPNAGAIMTSVSGLLEQTEKTATQKEATATQKEATATELAAAQKNKELGLAYEKGERMVSRRLRSSSFFWNVYVATQPLTIVIVLIVVVFISFSCLFLLFRRSHRQRNSSSRRIPPTPSPRMVTTCRTSTSCRTTSTSTPSRRPRRTSRPKCRAGSA